MTLTFQRSRTDADALKAYADLFRDCFPQAHHLTPVYLEWLYALNPAGTVVGMDAMDGDRLAAHYVCIPAPVRLFGEERRALLSLNTATHPAYQGKGLFTTLAQKTYAEAADLGYTAVFGVANANSTPGFIRKLGFQAVTSLDARLGMGRLIDVDWDAVATEAEFRRDWTSRDLAWRVASPANQLLVTSASATSTGLFTRTDRKMIDVWGETELTLPAVPSPQRRPSLLRLFLGKYPAGTASYRRSAAIPSSLRPSPLNLIYRDLRNDGAKVNADRVCFNFFDFDAY
jgi:GNAT superfamily N-acetyltransferase